MALQQFIETIIKEELSAASNQFSIEELISIQTRRDVYTYLNQTLGHPLNGGSARIVYAIDDKTVIKYAYDGDYYQNENELRNSKCLGKHYAVQVFQHHPEFWWLIEERLTQTTRTSLPEKFHELTGMLTDVATIKELFGFNSIKNDWDGIVHETTKVLHDKLMQNQWYSGLKKSLDGCGVSAIDFGFPNWGIRDSTGELVLLDLGF